MRLRRLTVIAVLAAGIVLLAAAAAAAETIRSFTVLITVRPDGSMVVTETIDYDFGSQERHGIFRDIPTRARFDDVYDRVTPISDVTVTATAAPGDAEVSEEPGGITRIRIGDPDSVVTGPHVYTITYRVDGAMNAFEDHDELYWNATGDEWEAPMHDVSVRVVMPGQIGRVACFQGWDRSTEPCRRAVIDGDTARFMSGRLLGPGEGLTFVLSVDKGVVTSPVPILDERWAFGRAFAVSGASIGLTAGVLALAGAGLFGAYIRVGRDRRFRGSVIDQTLGSASGEDELVPFGEGDVAAPVEFAPPEELRPGHLGLLVEERVHTRHVTATLVDLAARGHVHINELDRGFLRKPDWELVQGALPDPDAPRFEHLLLDGLFEARSSVRVSELRDTFAERLQKVKDALAADGMRRGWFAEAPDKVRGRWAGRATLLILVGAGLTYVLARYTHLAIAGLAVVLAGIALAALAGRMPARTAKGTALTRRVRGFRTVIETADRYVARWAEEENVFTRYLGYAVLFGVTDKWAKAFADIGIEAEVAGFYTGTRPFVAADFSESIDGFAVTAGGTLASTPSSSGSSGFSGGGSSGGGGGGGGGGSW
ncbi:MAG: DUF2207 domain-containing protein [Actinomycetota bacterium]